MGDGGRMALMALLALWAVLWGWSFVAYATTPPADMGFTRGLNRVTAFFGWQLAALLPAYAAWALGRRWPKGSGVRLATRVPLQLGLALFAVLAALVLWALAAG